MLFRLRHLALLSVLILAGPPLFGQSLEEADATLKSLIEIPAVSGHEGPVREWVISELERVVHVRGLDEQASLDTDEAGNVVLTLGSGPVRILFVAHMDEVGFEIQDLQADGTLLLRRRGGFYPQFYVGRTIYFDGGQGARPALVTGVDEKGMFRAETGARSAQEAAGAGFKKGLTGTIRKQYFPLANQRRMGRSMDDRVGCAALILAVRHIDVSKLDGRVVFVWSVQEEVGLNGAKVVAARIRTPVAVAVDTFVSGDSPLDPDHFAQANLSEGAVLRAADHSNLVPDAWVRRLRDLADREEIALQYGVTGGGNDGAPFTVFGAVNIPLGWPLRCSHSPADDMDLGDLVSLARMVTAMAEGLPHP